MTALIVIICVILGLVIFIAAVLKDCIGGQHRFEPMIKVHPNGKDSLPLRYKRCVNCGKIKL